MTPKQSLDNKRSETLDKIVNTWLDKKQLKTEILLFCQEIVDDVYLTMDLENDHLGDVYDGLTAAIQAVMVDINDIDGVDDRRDDSGKTE